MYDSSKFSHLIGTSYEDVDCWGIVKIFYKAVFNIELKAYYQERPKDRSDILAMIYSVEGEFEKVDKPQFGDIILFKMYGVPSHIAVYLDHTDFLHTSKGSDCVIDKLKKWEKSVVAFYRIKK